MIEKVRAKPRVPDTFGFEHTGRMGWMSHQKWKEAKQEPSMLPGPAVPGC